MLSMNKITLKDGDIEISIESDENIDKVSAFANGHYHEILEGRKSMARFFSIPTESEEEEPEEDGVIPPITKELRPDLIAVSKSYA